MRIKKRERARKKWTEPFSIDQYISWKNIWIGDKKNIVFQLWMKKTLNYSLTKVHKNLLKCQEQQTISESERLISETFLWHLNAVPNKNLGCLQLQFTVVLTEILLPFIAKTYTIWQLNNLKNLWTGKNSFFIHWLKKSGQPS